MEIGQKPLKNLIGNLAVTPSPFYLLREVLRWEVPILRKLESFKNASSIGKANLALLNEAGYDGIELVFWGLFLDDWKINEARLKNFQKSGLPFYTFHGCYESFPRKFRNVYLNLATDDPKIKDAILAHIEVAARLKKGEKTILVFHPGIIKRKKDKEKAFCNVINNLAPCLDFAQKNNVILTIENMPYCNDETEYCVREPDLQYIFSRLPHSNLKMTFDWGHLNTLTLRKDSKKYLAHKRNYNNRNFSFSHINKFIDTFGKNIVHAHIHYNQSHLSAERKIELGFLKTFIKTAFFWSKIASMIRKSAYLDSCDEHLALNKIQEKYRGDYTQTMKNLLQKSSILDYGYITHEIVPKRVFKIFTYQKNGAKEEDYGESLRIFKKMIS